MAGVVGFLAQVDLRGCANAVAELATAVRALHL
jgi:hypothetical protein